MDAGPSEDAGAGEDGGAEGDAGDVMDGAADSAVVMDAGTDGGKEDAGPRPETYPRLLVATNEGVRVWDTIDTLAMGENRAPTLTLTGSTDAQGLAQRGDTLFVARGDMTEAVAIYDGVSTITDAAPAASIPVSALLRFTSATQLAFDGDDFLYLPELGAVGRANDAATMRGAATLSATFAHPFMQLASMTSVGDRLFAGQISGAGVQVWEGAPTATGDPEPSFTLDMGCVSWAMTSSGDALVVGCGSDIRIWRSATTATEGLAADVTLPIPDGSPATNVWGVAVRNDELVAITTSPPALLIWEGFAALTSGTARTHQIPVTAGPPRRVAIDAMGNRYVLVRGGFSGVLFIPASATPAIGGTLNAAGATDMLLLD